MKSRTCFALLTMVAGFACTCSSKAPEEEGTVDPLECPPKVAECLDYGAWYACAYGGEKPRSRQLVSAETDEACSMCNVVYGGKTIPLPPVSFEKDVVPIIQRACGASDCHDNDVDTVSHPAEEKAAGQMFLGYLCGSGWTPAGCKDPAKRLTKEERTRVIEKNMLVDSKTAPEKKRVVPYEPENSFLMDKIDGCLDAKVLKLDCKALPGTLDKDNPPACGDQMPRGTDAAIELEEREIFRRWVAEGAQDN